MVDVLVGRVHRFDPSRGDHLVQDMGCPVGAVGLREAGGLVLALVDHFAIAEDSGKVTEVPGFSIDKAHVRFNDGKVDPWGGFYAGTMRWEEGEATGSLYQLSPDHSVRELLSGISVSNGLAWTVDKSFLYHIDTPTHQVRRFPIDPATGTVSDRRLVVDIGTGPGAPDGLTIDSEGCLWVALWGGGQVRRYDPAGRVLAVVELPTAHVSSVAFGGEHMDELYITTARFGRSQKQLWQEPHAGSVFWCQPGVSGFPPFKFRG